MSVLEELFHHTHRVREQLIEERSETGIDGNCHENAVKLCEYLHQNTDFTPYLRWGVIAESTDAYESMQDAEDESAVHFWVEVQAEQYGWVIIDPFSMESQPDDISRGEIIVTEVLPETYYCLPDTLFEYEPNHISPDSILCYEDYQSLKEHISPI